MSEDFVRAVLREHAQANMPDGVDPRLAIRSRLQTAQGKGESKRTLGLRLTLGLRPALMVSAVVVTLAVFGALLWTAQPRPVSAAEILAQAEQVAKDGSASGVSSAHWVTRYRVQYLGQDGFVEGRNETWFRAPDDLFAEVSTRGPKGEKTQTSSLANGDTAYYPLTGHDEIRIMTLDKGDPRTFGPWSLEQVSQGASRLGSMKDIYTVTLVGTEQVAGRMAYVLERNIKPEALGGEDRLQVLVHRSRLWIDQEFYLVLRSRAWNADGELVEEADCESLELNKPVDPTLFTFKPPAGYVLADMRPATADEVLRGWQAVSRQTGATLYAPTTLTKGLRQGKPYYLTTQGVVSQALISSGKYGDALYAVIVQGPQSAIREEGMGTGTAVQVGSRQGRLYRENETNRLVFDIGGTRILLYSSNVGDQVLDGLIQVAESLAPINTK